MGEVVVYRPTPDNKLYRFVGTAVSYVKRGKLEAARDYLRSLPPPIRSQIIRTLARAGYLDGPDF